MMLGVLIQRIDSMNQRTDSMIQRTDSMIQCTDSIIQRTDLVDACTGWAALLQALSTPGALVRPSL